MALGDKFYPKIRIFKQTDINALVVNSDGSAKDPTEANASYQFGYTGIIGAVDLSLVSLNIIKGINTNLGGCTIVITNAKSFIESGFIKLGFNEFIEIKFSTKITETDTTTPVTWFRGYIQKVKYVKINTFEDDLILECVGEGVILKERLTKIDRLRPFGKITRLNETSGEVVHIEETGFLDELYRGTLEYEAANTDQVGVTQFFQRGGFNFDPRTKRLGVAVTAKDKLPVSITRFPFQTKVPEIIKDMFGIIPTTIPTGSQEYQTPLVTPNEKRQLLRLINSGNDVQNIDLLLPQFKSDYGTILSALDTLSAAVNAIYYIDNKGHFNFKQSPDISGKIIDVDTNLYNPYSFSDDIINNGYSSVTGLGYNPQEFNIFRENSSETFTSNLNRATRWRSAGTPNGSDYNVNSFRRSNNIGVVFKTGANTDISSIELPLIRIGDITSALEWEIREKDTAAITAKYDTTAEDSKLILARGVITATLLNELVPYMYETWSDTGNDTNRSIEKIDATFTTANADNVTPANQAGLIELPIVAENLRPNTEYMLVIRPPVDINGLPINGIPSVKAANGITDNLLFVYALIESGSLQSLNNLRRWGTTPSGLAQTGGSSFEPTGGISVLSDSTFRVLQVLTPFSEDTTLGDNKVPAGSGNKTSIPLVLGRIPIRVNVKRSTVVTSENILLRDSLGLREITVPFPSNANAAVVKSTILDIQLNLFNQRNRVYSDFVYEFPTTILEAGNSIDVQDNNNLTGIGLQQTVLVSQITIDISAESGKQYTDRITVKATELL